MPEWPPAVTAVRAGDWDRYVADYHDARPGITEDVLAGARDACGRSPYDWLAEAVAPDATTVVDLGCGSGPVGRLLCGRLPGGRPLGGSVVRGRRVVGVDRSAGELARARSSSPAALLVRARADALPLADGSVDAVVASMALMLLWPLEGVLAEAARLLRPGGVFAATVPVRSPAPGPGPARPFAEIVDALGQGPIAYPEPLTDCTAGGRFSASGLTLGSDRLGLFTLTVGEPAEAEHLVHSFYAPNVGPGRVAAVVEELQRRVAAAPVEVVYQIRRLVAQR